MFLEEKYVKPCPRCGRDRIWVEVKEYLGQDEDDEPIYVTETSGWEGRCFCEIKEVRCPHCKKTWKRKSPDDIAPVAVVNPFQQLLCIHCGNRLSEKDVKFYSIFELSS